MNFNTVITSLESLQGGANPNLIISIKQIQGSIIAFLADNN